MNDLRYALRSLRNHSGFTAAAVLTLGLGIGGTSTMFGVLDGLFLSPPAGVSEPDDVVRLYIVRRAGSIQAPSGGGGSYPDLEAMRTGGRNLAGLAAFDYPGSFDYGRGERAARVRGQAVTADFFSVLGIRPALGRLFVPDDDASGTVPVAVLGHGFWRREFGGDSGVVGRAIELDGRTFTMVGIADPEFTGLGAEPLDVWVPVVAITSPRERADALYLWLNFVGRLRPGASGTQAATDAATALRHAASVVPELDPAPSVVLGPLNDRSGPQRPQSASIALWLALATGIVLVIACANVANLLLARGATRRREMAVRVSLGVSGGRLVRHVLTESMVLALLGGTVGLVLAVWGADLARQFPVPPSAPRLDLRLIGFTLAVSLGTGLMFGLAPALQALRTDLAAGLKAADPGAAARGGLRAGLVAFQVALSVALLISAGLFIRSLARVYAVDAGVDAGRVLVASLKLEEAGYNGTARDAFYDRAIERLRALPDVEQASLARFAPLDGAAMTISFRVPGGDTLAIEEGPYQNVVASGFFETTGMRLLRGRGFTERDRAGSEPVAVLNQTMARLVAGGNDPIGACVPLGAQTRTGGCTRIVGVVADARHRYLQETAVPYVFLPRGQYPLASGFRDPAILIRARGEPVKIAPSVRGAIQSLAADLPYISLQPMESLFDWYVLPFRIGARLFTLFGVLALGMAAVGLYAVLAHLVAQRTREIGVRVSLGARAGQVVQFVIRQGMLPVAVGLGVGMPAAFIATRFIRSLLYGVSARDPVTFLVVPVVLVAAALLASYLPARRATKVDPMVALRAE